jgi:hypothetical protein
VWVGQRAVVGVVKVAVKVVVVMVVRMVVGAMALDGMKSKCKCKWGKKLGNTGRSSLGGEEFGFFLLF